MGELLAATQRAKGAKGIGNPKKCGAVVLPHSEPTLAELGLTKRESTEARADVHPVAAGVPAAQVSTRRRCPVSPHPPKRSRGGSAIGTTRGR